MKTKKESNKAQCVQKTRAQSEEGDAILIPGNQKDVVGAGKMSYDEYLAVLKDSQGKQRREFARLFFNIPLSFKGEIEKKNAKKVCFKRIFTTGMYPDGEMFDGKEDHVWMDKADFEEFQVGDSVQFTAEVYRYVKTGDGNLIDYGLRNPEEITPIPSYELPTDEELAEQEINSIVCETCYLREHCSGWCMRPKKEIKRIKKQMKQMILGGKD